MKTTRELFEEVINTKGIETTLGCAANTVYQLRRNFNNGKVSLDKMHEILEAAGYQVVQPTLWAKPSEAVISIRKIQEGMNRVKDLL